LDNVGSSKHVHSVPMHLVGKYGEGTYVTCRFFWFLFSSSDSSESFIESEEASETSMLVAFGLLDALSENVSNKSK